MDRRQTMIQVYRDDYEEGTVDHHTPFLPSVNPQAEPRWAKKSQHSRRKRLLIASGALATLYLVFCVWFAYAQWENFAADDEGFDGFPHPKLPWPFPKHRPHGPHRPKHPHHHPHFFPHPTVLACAPVPTPSSSVATLESVELSVTLPHHKAVVIHDHLLHGNISVVKTPHVANVTEMSGNKTLEVAITVANRTHWHPHPPHPPKSDALGDGEEEKEEEKGFLLCAITFGPPPHHKPKDAPEELEEEEKPRHPHPHPHPPFHPHPVIVTILPAHNETYPKLPGHGCPHRRRPSPPGGSPPPPPPGGPNDEEESSELQLSVLSHAWRSTISFLFPMLSISHPRHHPRFPHHPHHPPPPPPFEVTSLTVSVPHFVPVKYGLPFHRPPFHPPPHRRH